MPWIVVLPATAHTTKGVHVSWGRLFVMFGCHRTREGTEHTKRLVLDELERRKQERANANP